MGAFLFSGLLASTITVADETVTVRHVLDGDSLLLSDGRQVRLIGVNTPELGKDNAPDQPLARQARARLAKLIMNKRVTLVFEQERRDHYGRTLARVILPDESDAGEQLLREGLAWTIAIPPNLEKLETNLAAENEARIMRRGVWNEPAYAPKPADRLTLRDTGFLLIEGRILGYGQGRQLIYFDLAPTVALAVPRETWKKYFEVQMDDWIGRRVIARGWLTEERDRRSGTGTYRLRSQGRNVAFAEPRTQSKGRLRLRVPHPAMLTWRD